MQAIILAGGKGARLKPYTTILPKPLMPIGDYPILEIIIKQLKYFGVEEVIFAVGYLKELLKAFFDDGQKWGIKIRYSVEEKPLGTAAPLKLIGDLDDNFLVMNGDVLTNLNFQDFYDFHINSQAFCTISTFSKKVPIDLGVLKLGNNKELTDYIEKPVLDYQVSMGIYALNRKVLDYIPENTYLDFPSLMKILLNRQKKVIGFNFQGYWLDIGRPDDYTTAIDEFEKHKSEFLWES